MKNRLLSLLLAGALLLGTLSGCGAGGQEEQGEQNPPPSSSESSSSEAAPSSEAESSAAEPASPEPAGEGPITVTDQAGREVTLDAPAETVVSCYYLVTASLLTLGQKEKITGIELKAASRGLYQLCAPEFLDLPQVGSGKETNIEAIAALEPDLVLLPKKQAEAAETLAGLGIPTAVVEPETYEAYNEMIRMLGRLCGCETEAEALTAYYDGVVRRVTALTADTERPSVYLCGDATYLRTCAGGMYQRELIEMAGGACVSAELEGSKWADISAEQLAAWDPEVIFAVQYAEYSPDDIRSDTALAGIRAVAGDRIYTVPSEIEAWDYPQPSSILGLLWMTHILHPSLVTEEEYLREAQLFYQTYFGIEVTKEQMGIA